MEPLTNKNYFDIDNQRRYWSVSQFKAFSNCEAEAMAELIGWQREETTSLLVGSYVDAWFSGEMDDFLMKHSSIISSRTGELKADYRHADVIIEQIEDQPLLMEYLTGDKQVIRTAELFGVPWKIKMDVYLPEKRIVDLKVVKDFKPLYKEGYGMVNWIQYWGYDIQGAVYQKIEQLSANRAEPLPFYIVAATKEKVPDVALIHIPQHVLDAALKVVEHKIDRFDLVKQEMLEPERCEKCDYCKATKLITGAVEYELREGGDN